MDPSTSLAATMITFVIIGMLGIVALYTICFVGPKSAVKEEQDRLEPDMERPVKCRSCGGADWETVEQRTPAGQCEFYCRCLHCGNRTQAFELALEAELAWKAQEGLLRNRSEKMQRVYG